MGVKQVRFCELSNWASKKNQLATNLKRKQDMQRMQV